MSDWTMEGYEPSKNEDGIFELMKGKGNVCQVNSSIIDVKEAGVNERTGEAYDAYTRLQYEIEVVSDTYKGRRIWKTYNLDSEERTGKKELTPREKLANVFFTLGLEFTNLEGLRLANEKFAEMMLVVSFHSFTPKDSKDPMQLHTITGVHSGEAVASESADVPF